MKNSATTHARRRAILTWIARLGVSAAILTVLFRIVPLQEVWREAQRLSPALWVTALAVFLAGHAAAAAKWRLLIGRGVTFMHAFQAHLAGLAANLCLPGLAGGDVVRAGLVFPEAHDKSLLVVGSVADRLLDIGGLLVFAIVGAVLLWRPQYAGQGMLPWFLLGSAAGLAGVLAIFGTAALLAHRVLRRTRPRRRLGRWVAHAVAVTAALVRAPARLLLCLMISMLVQATFIAINIAFARAVGLAVPTAAWFFAWSTAKIVAIAPVSLGGLGVREATLARLLVPFGADPAQVIAIGLVWQTLLYASGLIGALALLVWKPDRVAQRALALEPVEHAS